MQQKRILVTGGKGFLGANVSRQLSTLNRYTVFSPASSEYDFRNMEDIRRAFSDIQPDIVVHLAARVGGIGENRAHPGQLFYDNLTMGVQLMEHAREARVEQFVNVGTVCSYPSETPVPFSEDSLWNGYPEPTNAPYGIAKKALLTQALAYRDEYGFPSDYLILTNLYGPGDNFDLESSHVIPALIRKFQTAMDEGKQEVVLWGDGTPTRDFLYVKDAARAIVTIVENSPGVLPINIGSGSEVAITDLAQLIADKVGFRGEIYWDGSYPNGQMRRLIDTSKAERCLQFKTSLSLAEGLEETVKWYRKQKIPACCP